MTDFFDRLLLRAAGGGDSARPASRVLPDSFALVPVDAESFGPVVVDPRGQAHGPAIDEVFDGSPTAPPSRRRQEAHNPSAPRRGESRVVAAPDAARPPAPTPQALGSTPPWHLRAASRIGQASSFPLTRPGQPEGPIPGSTTPDRSTRAEFLTTTAQRPEQQARQAASTESTETPSPIQVRAVPARPEPADIQSLVEPITPVANRSAADPELPVGQTVVRVSIGRIDVRATTPAPPPVRRSREDAAAPRLSLDAYLERHKR